MAGSLDTSSARLRSSSGLRPRGLVPARSSPGSASGSCVSCRGSFVECRGLVVVTAAVVAGLGFVAAAAIVARLCGLTPIVGRLDCLAAIVARLGLLAPIVARLDSLATVVSGLRDLPAVVAGLGLAALGRRAGVALVPPGALLALQL